MRLLANENFPASAVFALRTKGHDVLWVRTEVPGAGDTEIIGMAGREKRTILTFDKDFGEKVYREGSRVPSGVLLFRIPPVSPSYVARMVTAAIDSRDDWSGIFAVVQADRIRTRPLG